MLAARLLLSRIAPRDQRDARSTAAVLDAAADSLGKPRLPHIARNMEAHDIRHAWQLAEMSEDDWRSFDVPIGMKTAIRAELTTPTTREHATAVVEFNDNHLHTSVPNERLRRFLLIPDASGQEAGPMSSPSAIFLSLLTVPIEDRQNLMLALCELMALISGLFLPITLDFRRSPDLAVMKKGWDVAPTLLDAMDGVALCIFDINAMLVLYTVTMALIIATRGYRPDDEFCEATMLLMGSFFGAFFFCVLVPIFYIVMWHVFTDAASPYAAIGGIALMFVVISVLNHVSFKYFILEHYALEIYHLPRFAKSQMKQVVPWLGRSLTDKALRPKAEMEAAKLRERLLHLAARG